MHYYSGEMISQFQLLSDKIDQLAELTRSLRRENADLRLNNAALSTENVELCKRMEEAHRRVSTLLNSIPATEQNEEAA